MQAIPDCCGSPELELVRHVDEPPGPERDLQRCKSCGTFWRFDAQERMNFSGDGDHYWEWYTRLTPEEAAELS